MGLGPLLTRHHISADDYTANPPSQARELRQALNTLQQEEQLFGPDTELRLGFDRETRQTIVWVLDRVHNEVIRQIPAEDAIEMARRLRAAVP